MKTKLLSGMAALHARYFSSSEIKQEGVFYHFESDSGLLTLSGRGERVTWRGVTKSIGIALLDDNYVLKQVNFSKSKRIKRLGRYCFSRCLGLVSVDIPSTVESISESAFLDCKNLVELRCHALDPPKIEPDPFFYNQIYFCFVPKGTLETYRKATGWKNYAQYWVFIDQPIKGSVHVWEPGTLGVSILKQNPIHPPQITHLTLTGKLDETDFEFIRTQLPSLYSIDLSGLENTLLPEAAFAKTKLARITFPSSLTTIGERAFSGCRGLIGELLFPPTLTHIGPYAFKQCTGLGGTLRLPALLKSIGAYAFLGCTGLSGNLTLPPDMEQLGEYAFCSCIGLWGEISIPEKLLTLEEAVFSGCSSIEGVSMKNVSIVREKAFSGCSSIEQISCSGHQLPRLEGESVFKGVSHENCIIHIPYNQSIINAYFSTPQWSMFKNYREFREI